MQLQKGGGGDRDGKCGGRVVRGGDEEHGEGIRAERLTPYLPLGRDRLPGALRNQRGEWGREQHKHAAREKQAPAEDRTGWPAQA